MIYRVALWPSTHPVCTEPHSQVSGKFFLTWLFPLFSDLNFTGSFCFTGSVGTKKYMKWSHHMSYDQLHWNKQKKKIIWNMTQNHIRNYKIFKSIWAMSFSINKKNKTRSTPSCSGPILAQKMRQKIQGSSAPRVVFSNIMPKMDFCYSCRFSWEKTH